MNPELVRCADISETYGCSLARVMRKRQNKHGISRGVQVIFSPETAVPGSVVESEDEPLHKRSVTGTISYMPAIFGCHCASAVVQQIIR
jgi:tRNA A37 threonylcarbamoyladenosine dehydratase